MEARGLAAGQLTAYEENCDKRYLDHFVELFFQECLQHCKNAFVFIPVSSCFLIIGIVAALHWAPFHSKTLKKPAFICSFFLSLILVSINVGQIIAVIVPMINSNSAPHKGSVL